MTSAATPARDVLSQVDAEARAARVRDTSYALHISLTGGSPVYQGDVTITFALEGSGDTFLDHRGKRIALLEVNGQRIAAPEWNGYRLTLPGSALDARNTVHIVYENEYDHTGDGLHQFIDPEDGQEYIYTNFEPYEAHRLFPCFDQPDIKARYTVKVTAPAEWEVIANSRETGRQDAGDGRSTRSFAPTEPFSTYLFAIVAGPYRAFRAEHNGIPLGFFCRGSMVKHFEEEELFTITRQGLDFFQEFFAYPYPFGKYDQVFVPEFNAGAMENVACVTHSESYLFRDPPTENQRQSRGEVMLHEMAHMWFGNLVTMRWWNDLWLNESFASYMAYLALTSNTRFTQAWTEFHNGMKAWAYRQDQLVTTHPIAGEVADTDQTFLNFDGITYGKGAAVLKQLVATIGLEGFRDGMRRYFQRHAFGNATLSQFLTALEEGSGRDLHAWARLWLETASLNTLSTSWEQDGERIARLSLAQSAPGEYQTLRPHTVEVGLAREQDGGIVVEALRAAIEAAEAEVEAARGMPAPAFVFPNYNDHAYAKVALDPASLGYIRDNLERVTDPLLRLLLWTSLWDMVRDQQLTARDFLALAGDKVRHETDLELVEGIISRCLGAAGRYTPEVQRDSAFHAFFQVCQERLRAAPHGDAQIIWARALIGAAVVSEDIEVMLRLVDGEDAVPGLRIDQDMRWEAAIKCVALGREGAAQRVAAERQRDPSDRGQRATLRAETSVPDAAVKAAAWEKIHGAGYGSLHLTAAAMGGFNWYRQRPLLEPYVEQFFAAVPSITQGRDKEFSRAYFSSLFPHYRIDRDTLARSERLLAEVGGQDVLLARMLREANDDLLRAIRCREYAEQA